MIKRMVIGFFLFCICGFNANNSFAIMLKSDPNQLLRQAQSVVVGKVINVSSYWNVTHTRIFTVSTIAVDEDLNQSGLYDHIRIITPGGKVGDIVEEVSDTPSFLEGDECILFLKGLSPELLTEINLKPTGSMDDIYEVLGGFQGKFDVVDNKIGYISFESFRQSIIDGYIDSSVFNPQKSANQSNGIYYNTISGISPSSASAGTGSKITISGSDFGSSVGTPYFFYRSVYAYGNSSWASSWSDTSVDVTVPIFSASGYPAAAGSGPVFLKTSTGTNSNYFPFTVTFAYGQIKWAESIVGYKVNPGGNSDFLSAVNNAAASWNSVSGINFKLNFDGTTTASDYTTNQVNEIVWGVISDPSIIGQASIKYSGSTIIECDIKFNTQFSWSTASTTPADSMDVQTIAAHEIGHWLNLRDLYGDLSGYPSDSSKIMYGYGSTGQQKRSLHQNDSDGIRYIYPSSDNPILTVSPDNQNVGIDSGTTTFNVSNTGTGTMTWNAAVASGSWLTITSGSSGTNSGNIMCSFPANTSSSSRTASITITADGATGSPKTVTVTQAGGSSPTKSIIGSNSIDDMDVVKITDMSGSLPVNGGAVTVRAWDKNGSEIPQASYAPLLTVNNYSTTSIRGMDLADRFPTSEPSMYVFSVESSKMFITNVNSSNDGAVKVPIIFSSGINTFVSNSIGARNTVKITDMSGTLSSTGITVSIRAWDISGKEIPESTSATPIKLYNHGTTSLAGVSIAARFPTGSPLTYAFSIDSPKLVISNVKNSSDGTLNIPSVYTAGVSNFVSNSIGPRNTIYISDFSGNLASGGSSVTVRAWNASGTEIPESEFVDAYKIYNFETIKIQGADLASRFPSGTPITYEFTVASSKLVITSIKSSSDNVINIPTVYSSGMTNYATNYVSDLNTIKISDMSGSIPTGGAAITVVARDVDGNQIAESGTAAALKLYNFGTTTIAGSDLQDRFPGGTPVSYEFTIGSSNAIVTNLTNSTDGTINIPTVYNIGSYGGI